MDPGCIAVCWPSPALQGPLQGTASPTGPWGGFPCLSWTADDLYALKITSLGLSPAALEDWKEGGQEALKGEVCSLMSADQARRSPRPVLPP